MSFRGRPVTNRYLDLLEKERIYGRHVKKVVRSRATIDTTQPEVPRRFLVSERNNTRYRNGLLRTFAKRSRMISEVDGRRPKTSDSGGGNTTGAPSGTGFKRFSDAKTPQTVKGQENRLFENEKFAMTPEKRVRKIDMVRIGYGEKPIVETQEVYDESSAIGPQHDEYESDENVPENENSSDEHEFDGTTAAVRIEDGAAEHGMFVT